jgi:hypothetical protein
MKPLISIRVSEFERPCSLLSYLKVFERAQHAHR